MFISQRVTASLMVVFGLSMGCQLERMFPEEVGAGAARLSVRNSAKLIAFVNADTTCGFSSPRVIQGYRQEGELGSIGTVTWTVENCEIDFGDEPVFVGEDCNASKTTVKGKITANATRTVTGILTGNPEQPAIPQSPDAVVIAISADVEGYEPRLSDKITALLMQHAHVELTAGIHLAQSISLGVCSVSTSDVTLTSIKVTDALYTMDDGERVFDVEVPSVNISAQLGIYNDVENRINGKITVWDKEVDLSSDHKLDPDYDAKEFHDSYTCTADMVLPVTFECLPLTPKLAEGAAKLTISNVGNLVSYMATDTRCGFESPAVKAAGVVTGEVGKDGGEIVYRINTPCVVELPVKTAVDEDCTGAVTYMEGKASVTGTMRLRGRVSGDPLQPIIPSTRDPVEITFDADFERFRVSTDTSSQSLEIVTGKITGRVKPRMAVDTFTGACSIGTPHVTFEDITWAAGGEVILRADGNALRLNIEGATLDAQNGVKDGRENFLEGAISVDGDVYPIPLSGEPILDPTYDAATFNAGFACIPHMAPAMSDEQCNFHQIIGDGAARLVIQTVGTLASMVNSDTNCGFEDTLGVLISPTEVLGEVGEMGSMTWAVAECTVGTEELVVFSEDCIGGATFASGMAMVDAERTVEGERTTQFLVVDAIEPRNSQSVEIRVTSAELSEFVTYPLGAGETVPMGKLTIHEGTLSATVAPATGARADDMSTYDVATPVARITNVRLQNATATLEAQGKKFEINITDTNLSATNGSLNGAINQIAGTITFDGDTIDVGGALNPSYNQTRFDQSYVCTENLAGTLH